VKTCLRCRSAMLSEPFDDDIGSGDAWICMACGERLETYTQLHNGGMTEARVRELMHPTNLGRPPGRRI
jgi:hypothetical protein